MVKKLEVLGMVCPFPLVKAKEEIAGLSSGDELVIDFDCTQATETIPRWAAEAGHSITKFEKTGPAQWSITIKKK
jgi:TusA-related sulfurtransferase